MPSTAERVDAMNAAGVPILALDIATGCDPTTGALGEPHVRATATVALGRPKLGSFLDPGRDAAGDLWCAPIGMRDADADGIDVDAFVLDGRRVRRAAPARAPTMRRSAAPARRWSIAGSEQFPGAAVLCALGAARAGAGYVTVAAPLAAAAALRAHLIEQVVVTYDESDPRRARSRRSSICATTATRSRIGPGLGLSDAIGEIVRGVMAATQLPIVADASALFHLAKQLARFRRQSADPHAARRRVRAALRQRHGRRRASALARLRAFVDEYGITTLLKGRTTLIADRTSVHVNPTGTPALATAGTGDVLTGIIGTLLAQGLCAARCGARSARTGTGWPAAAPPPRGRSASSPATSRTRSAARPTSRRRRSRSVSHRRVSFMNVVLADRLQFAFTIMFHYLFPIGTMGLAPMICWYAWRATRSGSDSIAGRRRF